MRRAWWAALLVAVAFAAQAGQAIVPARDLQADARMAARQHLPILLFFAANSCHYCEAVEQSYLQPMVRSGEDRGRVLLRVIHVDEGAPLRDFDGRMTTHAAYAREHGVRLTPVVRLVNGRGDQLVPQLLGYTSPDFYGSYLESAITDAIAKVRTQSPAKG